MDLTALVIGLVLGAIAGILFFTALAMSVRAALQAEKTGNVLLIGAAIRIGLLLLAGWGASQLGAWNFAGFSMGFLVVRMVAVAWARAPLEKEVT